MALCAAGLMALLLGDALRAQTEPPAEAAPNAHSGSRATSPKLTAPTPPTGHPIAPMALPPAATLPAAPFTPSAASASAKSMPMPDPMPIGSAGLAPLVMNWRLPGFVNAVWDVGHTPHVPLRVWPVVRPGKLLACASNDAVSAQVKLEFGRLLALHHVGDPESVQQALRPNWLAIYRTELARPYALAPGNLPDSVTAYWVALWRMVNPQLDVSVPTVQRLRDRMRGALLAQPGLGQLSCAERQRLSETLIYNTVLLQSQRQGLRDLGDEAALQAAVAHYQRVGLETWQLDLRGMRLDALSH